MSGDWRGSQLMLKLMAPNCQTGSRIVLVLHFINLAKPLAVLHNLLASLRPIIDRPIIDFLNA